MRRHVFLRLGLLLAAYWLAAGSVRAQKVGLVLSGGGAKGLAHIGVLKQLEQNQIPIDYIVGTSMGAVVGGMYAAGYSPDEIEQIALSPEFQSWTSGKPLESHVFNYLITEASPASLHLGVAVDSALHFQASTALIRDLNLNFALARLLAPAASAAGYDFDKLLVPFRSLASEVFTRQQVVQKSGPLADAVRNSMAVPLAFRPIRNLDGRYLFDGGIYNTFPTDVMQRTYAPEVLIGVNVADPALKSYPYKTAERLLAGTLLFLGSDAADTLHLGPRDVLIQPDLTAYGIGDFSQAPALIAAGDSAARRQLALLRQRIGRRADTTSLGQRRRRFRAAARPLRFTVVEVLGLRADQAAYVRRFFRRTGPTYSLAEIEAGYYRLAAEEYFRNLYPRIRYDARQAGYVFSVDPQRRENLKLDAGLTLASRPIDNLYLGVEYRYLRRLLYSAGANVNLGPFFNAVQGAVRVSVPGRLPLYVEPQFTYNQWNYQRTGGLFGRDVLSTQVRQTDRKLGVQVGAGPRYRGRVLLDIGAFLTRDSYASSPDRTGEAATDQLALRGGTAAVQLTRYTLNRRQYATAGQYLVAGLRGVRGTATYSPGADALAAASTDHQQWLQFRAAAEQYFPLRGEHHAWGYLLALTASGQGPFATYRASLARAPGFEPLPDARTLFLDHYRSARYVAAGLRYTRPLLGKLEWRTEVYGHVNFRPWREGELQQAERQKGLERPRVTASTGVVYSTPVGPLALHARYYDDPAGGFGVYAHLGYLLFRDRALD